MRSCFNQKKFDYSIDQNFEEVMRCCQQQWRKRQGGGTWISDSMIQAYLQLHRQGYAHSVEVWQNGELVGGLYGVCIGKIFYGESMFATVSNASKAGFINLVRALDKLNFWLIDCQQETQHLKSLGGRPIPRVDFLDYMKKNDNAENEIINWPDLAKDW